MTCVNSKTLIYVFIPIIEIWTLSIPGTCTSASSLNTKKIVQQCTYKLIMKEHRTPSNPGWDYWMCRGLLRKKYDENDGHQQGLLMHENKPPHHYIPPLSIKTVGISRERKTQAVDRYYVLPKQQWLDVNPELSAIVVLKEYHNDESAMETPRLK